MAVASAADAPGNRIGRECRDIEAFARHPGRLTLGLRGDATATFGDILFYMLPFIFMRGVPAMQYQGEGVVQMEAEARWQFWKRLSLVGFGGAWMRPWSIWEGRIRG